MGLSDRLAHAWNAFSKSPDKKNFTPEYGSWTFGNPNLNYRPVVGDQTIVTSIYNQIAYRWRPTGGASASVAAA